MQNFPTIVPVVAAALIAPGGRVLMQRRPAGKAHGGLWEFPGGKVEEAESLHEALLREIAEELAIALDPSHLMPLTFAARAEQPHVVLLYTCRKWTGEPVCQEAGARLGWFAADELADLAMPPLDIPLAASVRLMLESTN